MLKFYRDKKGKYISSVCNASIHIFPYDYMDRGGWSVVHYRSSKYIVGYPDPLFVSTRLPHFASFKLAKEFANSMLCKAVYNKNLKVTYPNPTRYFQLGSDGNIKYVGIEEATLFADADAQTICSLLDYCKMVPTWELEWEMRHKNLAPEKVAINITKFMAKPKSK